MKFQVDVAYTERVLDTLFIDAPDKEQAEYEAINYVRDHNEIGMSDVEVLGVSEVG